MTKNQTYARTRKGAVSPLSRGCRLALIFVFAAWQNALLADDGVTVISTSPAATPAPEKSVASDGSPVVHKSAHKKKHPATDIASGTSATSTASTTPTSAPATSKTAAAPKTDVVVGPAPTHMPAVVATYPPPVGSITAHVTSAPPSKTVLVGPAPTSIPSPSASIPVSTSGAGGPAIETGLPVARYPGMGAPIQGVSTYIPKNVTLPGAPPASSAPHQPVFASAFPTSVIPATTSATGLYSTQGRANSSTSDFVFTNYKKPKNTYPWKTGIITTMFWIGEGSTPISSTTNVQSSWDEDWMSNNHGSDSPYNRNGYASGSHASTLNPFYIALPFNDLAFPDKAREYVPRSWHRESRDGKQVSACKDRWVWIKNAQGRSCFAQWEDVGPLTYDNAEYVFGSERPTGLGDNRAGLDVSPAVAQYLGIDGKNRITAWRFVDDEDVRPGPWLLLDEQAVLYEAMHQLKNSNPSELPIQRATEPLDDIESNKKKVEASKG
jgi:hypothetical protein